VSARRRLLLLVMVANLVLVITNAWERDWTAVAVCGFGFACMATIWVALGLGAAAKRGDRVEPDREAGR
jgi:hypothetical protein